MREGDIIGVAFCVAVEKEEGGTRQGEGDEEGARGNGPDECVCAVC